MRLRNIPGAKDAILECDWVIDEPERFKGKWESVFGEKRPLFLEVGMGKGRFLMDMARLHPERNFIGIEMYDSVIVKAVQKLENEELDNLKLIRMDARLIEDVFDKEIDLIYLNFSDPWPKNRHSERRLTSKSFLEIYDQVFAGDSHIIEKTDNIVLFAYSLESLSKYGYYFEKVTLDLASQSIFNIKTEYEEKFSNLGFKINYLEAIKRR